MMPLVLASASPRRVALLKALGLELQVIPSDAEETLEGPSPTEVVLANAKLKCEAVAKGLDRPAIVIGADTVVVVENRVLGKPVDEAEARTMLSELSGKTHDVLTGIALVKVDSGECASAVERTGVTFRTLSPDDIDCFVQAVMPLDRAGAYTVDGPGSLLVAHYNGCYHNVLGLPIILLDNMLREIGDGLFGRMDASRARFL
jgi:septum formation protein